MTLTGTVMHSGTLSGTPCAGPQSMPRARARTSFGTRSPPRCSGAALHCERSDTCCAIGMRTRHAYTRRSIWCASGRSRCPGREVCCERPPGSTPRLPRPAPWARLSLGGGRVLSGQLLCLHGAAGRHRADLEPRAAVGDDAIERAPDHLGGKADRHSAVRALSEGLRARHRDPGYTAAAVSTEAMSAVPLLRGGDRSIDGGGSVPALEASAESAYSFDAHRTSRRDRDAGQRSTQHAPPGRRSRDGHHHHPRQQVLEVPSRPTASLDRGGVEGVRRASTCVPCEVPFLRSVFPADRPWRQVCCFPVSFGLRRGLAHGGAAHTTDAPWTAPARLATPLCDRDAAALVACRRPDRTRDADPLDVSRPLEHRRYVLVSLRPPGAAEACGTTPGAPLGRVAMSIATLPALLQSFFTERLLTQRQVSTHTIASYRDTFRLLLRFAQRERHKRPSELNLSDLDADLIGSFLTSLEQQRRCSARTRNARLTAIRSFFY